MAGKPYHKPYEPWLYLAPALLFLIFYLIYPTCHTIFLSFMDRYGTQFNGINNFLKLFAENNNLIILRNNLLWLVTFTSMTIGLGFVIAFIIEKVRFEAFFKSVIFMPMAISFVGAGVIWKFMYTFRPEGAEQIGFLNMLLVSLKIKPVAFLVDTHLNNFALILVGIWIWTGFCMVILSAALKNIPDELLDAARVDGANGWQVFFYIILPLVWPVMVAVATTMVINVLKIFDIVYVMTNGDYGTEVIATGMYKQLFLHRNLGMASTFAVILLIVILPIIIFNLKKLLK